MLYQLMHVGSSSFYPVLTGVPPTEDIKSLDLLDSVYRSLRYGCEIHYTTVMCVMNHDGTPSSESLKRIKEAQKGLT